MKLPWVEARGPRRRELLLRVAARAAWIVALGLVLFAVLSWQMRTVGDLHMDDAYITFSFAKNLATGHGPVYSHGLRVEGYSNFLWMLLVAGPLAIRPSLDPYVVARLLGTAFLLLLGWATHALIRRVVRPSPLVWAGLILLALDVDLSVALLCGLETLPHAALLTAGFALWVRGRAGDERARRLVVPCFVAVALMRIDGFLALGFIIAAELLLSLIERRFRLGAFLRWAGPGVAVFLIWFAWRWRYYGLLLPTPAYAKALVPALLPDRGRTYAIEFWTSTGLALAVVPALFAFAGRARREAVVIAIFIAAHTAYVVRVGGDWMPFFRFFLEVVPLVVVLATWGIDEAVRRAARWRPLAGAVVVAMGAAAFAWMGIRVDGHAAQSEVERSKIEVRNYIAKEMKDNLSQGARLLAHVVRPGQKVVSDYAGVMAYFTDAAVIDMWGLCNVDVALHGTGEGVNPIWGKSCPRCYAEADPDYFHVISVASPGALRNRRDVLKSVWQWGAISRFLDPESFVVGSVTDVRAKRTLYFLEKRRPGSSFAARTPAPGIVVEYPFEGAKGRTAAK
jgi:hypothetical protein